MALTPGRDPEGAGVFSRVAINGENGIDSMMTVARGEKVSQGPLEPLFQVRILARQLRFNLVVEAGGGVTAWWREH